MGGVEGRPPVCCGSQKTNLTRFFSSTQKAKVELSKWHASLMNFEYLAIEMGLMNSSRIQKVVINANLTDNDEALRESTDSK